MIISQMKFRMLSRNVSVDFFSSESSAYINPSTSVLSSFYGDIPLVFALEINFWIPFHFILIVVFWFRLDWIKTLSDFNDFWILDSFFLLNYDSDNLRNEYRIFSFLNVDHDLSNIPLSSHQKLFSKLKKIYRMDIICEKQRTLWVKKSTNNFQFSVILKKIFLLKKMKN